MSAQNTIPIPELFVLWHPHCQVGEKLAQKIYGWLRPGNGLGPQVFYRSLPAPGAPSNGLPPHLPGDPRATNQASANIESKVAKLQIILPLIDENMVADPAWRHWIRELKPIPKQREMMPVALDATAYNMPGPLREMNYLRPAGLPLPIPDLSGAAFETVSRSLLKQLTEALCRLMLTWSMRTDAPAKTPTAANESSPKVKIFLSHAKADGTTPARRLRDYIYSQTQLAAFYDENDIAYGAMFAQILKMDLSSPETAALIAVRSAQYARRPWCRREASLFRRPRQEGKLGVGIERWRLYPAIVIEAMEGKELSTGIPELGNSSIVRWSDDEKDLEELIVTTVIRDAMLASFNSAMGAWIPFADNRIVINWLPDPTTLLHIPPVRSQQELEVVYPGRGLSGLELDILNEFFPNVTFRSFEYVLSEEVLS